MGFFDFLKDSGVDIIADDDEQNASAETLQQEASAAIRHFIDGQNLGLTNLKVNFDAVQGAVILEGEAPSREAAEKAALAAGNIKGIANVENRLTLVSAEETPSVQYHDVKSGETLSAIAKQYYGDANQYMKIFEANKPMLSDPNKIYPGQKLRIPA